jgi:hypothetical protein
MGAERSLNTPHLPPSTLSPTNSLRSTAKPWRLTSTPSPSADCEESCRVCVCVCVCVCSPYLTSDLHGLRLGQRDKPQESWEELEAR